ncbi:type I-C CRISPR-associated protein Cas7/Csd2 [Porphyromonas loveana]|uniref:type I-C CRISPR-associated protein Cas7/Csd2 n=1 Tax=Porphyromonas loveana TaxID=1884669 RepID=UPI0035A0C4D7
MEKVIINNRYDFVYLFDVQDGNPNGDPDAGNMPRIDPETGHGLVTDVCLKRKIRNYVEIAASTEQIDRETNKIFIKEGAILNNTIAEEYDATGKESKEAARTRMCANYYDVRTFGAVMSTGDKEKNAGQVRGAVQLTFARSISPIVANEHTITRMAVATVEESKKQKGDNRTMGRKATVPYALYRTHGFISSHLAKDTGFSEEDLNLFWQALEKMFDFDRSAARGLMAARRLIIFKHSSALGNAPAHELIERVCITQRDCSSPARRFEDFEIVINQDKLPEGIEIINKI